MTAREQALQRWWSWWGAYQRQLDRDELLEAKHLKDAYIAGWLAGGSHALKASAELAGLVPVLDLFSQLLAAELMQRADQDFDTEGGEAQS